jgi:hypothetical protein
MKNLTHWKNEFNYDYLGAYSLLPGEEKTLTIKEINKQKVKNVDGKEQECLVAYFLEPEKPMILNKTNCKIITKVYGTPYTENWKGVRIIIHALTVKAFGEMVDALRVKNENPDSNILQTIIDLFAVKKGAMTEEQKVATLRVTSNKEVRNYNKTLIFLKGL